MFSGLLDGDYRKLSLGMMTFLRDGSAFNPHSPCDQMANEQDRRPYSRALAVAY
jgi:hypothetical protein